MSVPQPVLTSDEVRQIMDRRALAAVAGQPGPPPMNQQISAEEWNLLQLHRVALQSRIVGSGVMSNLPDPMQESHGVAVVVLRSMRAELAGPFKGDEGWDSITLGMVHGMIDKWLGILGAHGQESGPPDPGAG